MSRLHVIALLTGLLMVGSAAADIQVKVVDERTGEKVPRCTVVIQTFSWPPRDLRRGQTGRNGEPATIRNVTSLYQDCEKLRKGVEYLGIKSCDELQVTAQTPNGEYTGQARLVRKDGRFEGTVTVEVSGDIAWCTPPIDALLLCNSFSRCPRCDEPCFVFFCCQAEFGCGCPFDCNCDPCFDLNCSCCSCAPRYSIQLGFRFCVLSSPGGCHGTAERYGARGRNRVH